MICWNRRSRDISQGFFENFMILENYITLMILVGFIFFGLVIQSKLWNSMIFVFWDRLIS